jgi:hypothetical protein
MAFPWEAIIRSEEFVSSPIANLIESRLARAAEV